MLKQTMRYTALIFIAVMMASVGAFSQEKPERGQRPSPSARSPMDSPRPRLGPAPPTTDRGSIVTPVPNRPPSGGGGYSGGTVSRGPTVPVQSWWHDRRWDRRTWDRCGGFFYRLNRTFGFFRVEDYLWRYAQGDSPLTPQVVELALSDSALLADSLMAASQNLRQIILDYQAERIIRDQFENGVDNTTDIIRDLAKKIRTDYFVDFLDQGRKVDLDDYDKVYSIEELLVLSDELSRLASHMKANFRYLTENDVTRTIDVQALQKPSMESLSKGIDRLAKVIENSADRL